MPPSLPTDSVLRIALLEDDAMLRERILLPGLANFGFAVVGTATAAALHDHLNTHAVDMVVLDVGLPDQDGFTVARNVRAAYPEIGIVMLTGRAATPDRVRGLSEGADAYLSKPVEIELLAATLHSLARRLRDTPAQVAPKRWQLDANGWCLVSPSGRTVALTKTERRVVDRLTMIPGQLVTRDELIAALTDNVYDFDAHRLDSLVYRLRRKVADSCGEVLPLNAVHGEGYVLNDAIG
ncbi:DNA-binding response OmpR family regulator [Luteimonas cucumeris]|uniref:DNA-binding response OmpR family regulator n=1 Tax=Luteimonas cucumeris TaxID=985012 RepID=A0A562LFF9_9GAMM|nr:DNA-binding response OmpR family regulator [Luteimonas cucumeris]